MSPLVDASRAGDIVVVKIVIDTNNHYPQRDGHIRELDDETTTSAELLQAHLPASKRC